MADLTEHKLTDSKRIHWLLSSLKSQHQLVRLELPGTDMTERTMVVSVSTDMSSFLLDAVTDSDIHKRITGGQPFSLATTHDGVDVRADSMAAIDTVEDEKGALYKIPFPSQLYYVQRRDAFRVSLAGLFTVPVSIELPPEFEENPIASAQCTLSNISANGCLVGVKDAGEELPTVCESSLVLNFQLAESNEGLSLSARVCHSRYLKRSSLWLIGFEFQALSPDMRSCLERYVVKLQLLARQKSLLG